MLFISAGHVFKDIVILYWVLLSIKSADEFCVISSSGPYGGEGKTVIR